ncbi:O-antigen ligase family protein [Ancylobacter dichloromethanicus]|uniref:O-antigen ligase family protein n=1 Tax=Ancylobacter dichloromethanicus TaxID=518825 RepID=UPI003623A5D1
MPLGLRAAALVEVTLKSAVVTLVCAAIIAAALFLTVSRAGFIAGIIGLVTLVLLALASTRRRWLIVAIALPASAVLFGALVLFGDDLGDRFATHGAGDARWPVAARTLEAVKDAPLTGFGYGSFDRMFSVYRGAEAFAPPGITGTRPTIPTSNCCSTSAFRPPRPFSCWSRCCWPRCSPTCCGARPRT